MAAHRFWRYWIHATAQGNIAFNEIELRSSAGGADLTGAGTASASSFFAASYEPDKLVDNNLATLWAANSGVPAWWQYDFGAGVEYDIVEFKIYPRTDSGLHTQSPSNLDMRYSDDGTNWTFAAIYETISWPDATPQTFTLASYGSYRYWRIYANQSSSASVGIAEMEFRSSVGGVDLTGSGTASASMAGSGAASNAFDDNTATFWGTWPNPWPQWLAYDFGGGVTHRIREIKITPRTDGFFGEAPSIFQLQYSSNGSHWFVAADFTATWPDATPQTFSVAVASAGAASSGLLTFVGS